LEKLHARPKAQDIDAWGCGGPYGQTKGGSAPALEDEKIVSMIPRLTLFPAALTAALVVFAALPAHALFGSKTKAAEQAGALLFRDQDCVHCHGPGGSGGKKGPDLAGLRKDKNWPSQRITNQILNGGQKMPPFSEALTDEQIAQLVAYLRAKHRPVPPPSTTPPRPPTP
jgi:mono/diheme cytochrome c family protein